MNEPTEEEKEKKGSGFLLMGGLSLIAMGIFSFLRGSKAEFEQIVTHWRNIVQDNRNPDIPASLILAIIHVESQGMSEYVSKDRTRFGLMGVPLYNSWQYRNIYGINASETKLMAPGFNVEYGSGYLLWLFKMIDRDVITPVDWAGFEDRLFPYAQLGAYSNWAIYTGLAYYDAGKIEFGKNELLINEGYVDRVWKLWKKYEDILRQ